MSSSRNRHLASDAWRVDSFVTHLRALDRSVQTRRAYKSDLVAFELWCSENEITSPRDVTRRDVRGYLAYLMERGDERSSTVRRLAALHTYFAWLVKDEHLDVDPTAGVSAPRAAQTLPALVVREQLDQLLDADWGEDPWALRDRAVCEILYGAGVRVSELCGLDLDDVNWRHSVLRVLGKGRKERLVPLHDKGMASIKTWRDRARAQLMSENTPSEALFSIAEDVD